MRIASFLLAALACPIGTTAHSQEPTSIEATGISPLEQRAQDVVTLFEADADPDTVFHPDFLASVPPAQVEALVTQLTAQFGSLVGVEKLTPTSDGSAAIALRFERAIANGTIEIETEQPHRIVTLLLTGFEPIDDSPAKIEADLAALPGDVAAYYGPIDGSDPILAIDADKQFAVGSTFKLYVLSALAREIASGVRQWNDVVTIDSKSYPSGILQDWPDGSPVTVHSLASLMISLSDNTATDLLIDLLGRERIMNEVVASGHSDPAATAPFLRTAEMFALKAGPEERLQAFRSADDAAQAAMLASMDPKGIAEADLVKAFSGKPVALDVEWFASPNDLRRLFAHIVANDASRAARGIMAISPSMGADSRDDWSYVGFKGGSEPGVLSFSWLLTDQEGRDFVLSLSWNDPEAPVDQGTLELLARRILALPL